MTVPDLPRLIRSADHGSGSREARAAQRAVQRGVLHEVRVGAFTPTSEWERLTPIQQHLLFVRAAVPQLADRLVVSHESALAVHGLPLLGDWPREIHVTDPRRERSQSWNGVRKHAGPLPDRDTTMVGGVHVTSILRTAVDLAASTPFDVAVASIDACLCRTGANNDELLSLLDERPRLRRRTSARRALSFASAKSGSAGESRCRCLLFELGTPRPELQKTFYDGDGMIGDVDFWFEREGAIVEFDGDQKYLDTRFSNGRSPSRIVLDERRRERRLSRLPEVRAIVRADWRDVSEPWRLRTMLVEAGIPVR